MEARKITIVQTKNQKKSVIMTSATTLGELKDDLRTNGIDYDGMTFYEGLSKTELKTNESILPHDIERNGVITNELVFMLTNTEKKIKSGFTSMSRIQAYDAIKAKGLQTKCLERFGKNFTMCKTADLIVLINESITEQSSRPKEELAITSTAPATPVNDKPHNCKGCVDNQARAAIKKLLDILYDADCISEREADSIMDILGGITHITFTKEENLESPYSQDEINQMFRGM